VIEKFIIIIQTTMPKQTNAYFLSRKGLALSVSWANGGPAASDVMKFHEFFAGSEFAMRCSQSGFQAASLGAGSSHRDSFSQETIRTNEKRRPR
jgi:hypothetical protein